MLDGQDWDPSEIQFREIKSVRETHTEVLNATSAIESHPAIDKNHPPID